MTTEYDVMNESCQLGERLGYSGESLREFVTNMFQAERQRRADQREEEQLKREFRTAELAKELELEKLRQNRPQVKTDASDKVQLSHSLPRLKLPKFDEKCDDIDSYLERFERYATAQGWPKLIWAANISLLLSGKALQAYVSLSSDCADNYDEVKKAVLHRYMLTEEGYRLLFRDTCPGKDDTVNQFSSVMCRYFDRWIEMAGTEKTYEGLKDLMLREQFLRKAHSDLRLFLKERTPKSLDAMKSLTEHYLAAHGGPMWKPFKTSRPRMDGGFSKAEAVVPGVQESVQIRSHIKPDRKCFLCSSSGHIAKDCKQFSRPRPSYASSRNSKDEKVAGVLEHPANTEPCDVNEEELLQAGSTQDGDGLEFSEGLVEGQRVDVLRDSGCTGVVVKQKFVTPNLMTGKEKRVELADRTIRVYPVAIVNIDTPYYKGKVEACCMPDSICDLIVGNLKGVISPPNKFNDQISPDKTIQSQYNCSVMDVNANLDVSGAVVTRQQSKERKKPFHSLKVATDSSPELPLNKEEQEMDESLLNYIHSTNRRDKGEFSLEVKHGVWQRLGSIKGCETSQVLVPTSRRKKILRLAHECLFGGHMGVKKTADRVMSCFYWPGVMGDIKKWCRTCDICQRTIPKGKVSRIPLGKVPIMNTPFQKIAIDLVGPIIPSSFQGNRYILTVVDYATRWPEAVPLPDISTERIAEALLAIFSRLGFPQEILSDRGSQFTSGLMKEICRLISVNQSFTTPYHPIANGLNERFNGTIKSMLKKMCQERPKDWDRYLPALLFAYREVPQSSTGFSPFELLYGRNVKGPLGLLKDAWVGNEDSEIYNTYQYVNDLKEKLEHTCKLVHDNLIKSSEVYKGHYDKKARVRYMNVGDKVLILLPTDNSKLLLSWKGPFEIVEVIDDFDYRVRLGDGKTKIFHANLLKLYEVRNELVGASIISHSDVEDEGTVIPLPEVKCNEGTYHDVSINPNLSLSQKQELKDLLGEFHAIFSDKPGLTNLEEHSIELIDLEPVRDKPYPVPYAVRETIENEVQSMLDQGIIERSNSDYNAPIVLVRKPDGSHRFCVNYKKLNKKTKFDSEPMNNPEDILSKLSGKTIFSKVDFTRGFWQIPMEESSKKYTAFNTQSGCYHFKRLPFGLVNSPATYNRMMRKLLFELDNIDNYVDDVLVHTKSWQDHISSLRSLFMKIKRAGLTIKPSKCLFGYGTVSFLGHDVGEGKVTPQDTTLERIISFPPPATKKQLRSFLGLVGWYQKFVPNYSLITVPLTDLLQKRQPNKLKWTDVHNHAFESLKALITSKPILRSPNLELPFVVQTDACDYAIGAVLLQRFDDGLLPVAFASRKLQPRETKYSVGERECLAIVFAFKKFDRYLYGREFVLNTDHSSLAYLQDKNPENGRLMRWSLFLQNYAYRVKVVKGKDNVLADFVSRL